MGKTMDLCSGCDAMAERKVVMHQGLALIAELVDEKGPYRLYCCQACGINWRVRDKDWGKPQ